MRSSRHLDTSDPEVRAEGHGKDMTTVRSAASIAGIEHEKSREESRLFSRHSTAYIASFNPTITAWFVWLAWLNVVL